jgi:hypothetical protein
VTNLEKKAKGGDKEAKELVDLMTRCLALLREGKPARLVEVSAEEKKAFNGLGLLSSKPVLYVCNVDESSADKGNSFSEAVKARAAEEGAMASSFPRRSRARSPSWRPRIRAIFSKPSALPSPASTASSALATSCCIW